MGLPQIIIVIPNIETLHFYHVGSLDPLGKGFGARAFYCLLGGRSGRLRGSILSLHQWVSYIYIYIYMSLSLSLSLYIYICICIYIYIYIYIFLCMCFEYIYIYIPVCKYVYLSIFIYIYIYNTYAHFSWGGVRAWGLGSMRVSWLGLCIPSSCWDLDNTSAVWRARAAPEASAARGLRVQASNVGAAIIRIGFGGSLL